ncbi:hypothetical protein [Psychrobium sp. 1_MG-2023]|uniref:hypothetical protein n=1 Tax=Psychrobium sp. 1_MG-2023 TaxID=3062624 RepID=UPI000C345B6A|nr:hypothetical protein [Psychrobium sp. 1_MG-2023]MDP2562747.1 hypothetical protein [Psychrobium sp. 1_MG-2023]PKF54170.1 hypothetical protein CW748_17100 [Alteromonadales bacterium alter-6D02]
MIALLFPKTRLLNRSRALSFFIVSAVLLLSGCAHKNYMESAENLMVSQQYELAVQEFTLALKEKPNDQLTRDKLTHAKSLLASWATDLLVKAQHAETNGQTAKALLLYAKVAQLTPNSSATSAYQRLYRELRDKSQIKVNIQPNNIYLDNTVAVNIDGLQVVNKRNSNIKQLKFAQSNPIFEIQQSNSTALTQYISGSQTIANPDILDLQHQLADIKDDRYSIKRSVRKLTRQLNQHKKSLQQFTSRKQSLEMKLLATNLTTERKQSLERQLSDVNNEHKYHKKQHEKAASRLTKQRKKLNKINHQQEHIADALIHTPPVVEVPVYTDYEYIQQHQTNTLTSVLYLTVNKITRTAKVMVDSQDDSHPAHPIIGLAANPMEVLNKTALSPRLAQERVHIAQQLLTQLVDEQYLNYFYQAQQTNNIDEKFDSLVAHGLMKRAGANQDAASQLQQMLSLEFGQGAHFNINQLLHLY